MADVERITSHKHPGAVFFKKAGTKDDFVCKFYPGHEAEAAAYEASPLLLAALERVRDLCAEETGLSVSGAFVDQIEGIVTLAIKEAFVG
jgi:hypothetical protein